MSRKSRSVIGDVNGIVQTGIMAAELANNYKQTEIMEKQLLQDYEIAMKQMEQASKLDAENENLLRELNEKIINVMTAIEKRLGNIENKLDEIGKYIRIWVRIRSEYEMIIGFHCKSSN